jgi:pimeloyl-ACP methyl ester carboxylesterase
MLLTWNNTGLRVGFEKYGEGPRKAFYIHGFPGSRFQGKFLEAHAQALGVEVIAFERPGYGQTECVMTKDGGAKSNLLTVTQMIEQMAGQLGWNKFHLIGVSGGAPYTLAAASHLGNSVASIHLVAGLGPLSEPQFSKVFSRKFHLTLRMMRRIPSPLLHRMILRRIATASPNPRRKRSFLPGLSRVDREVVSRPEIYEAVQRSVSAAFAQGVQGAKNDLRVYLGPWHLDWKKIQCPTQIWHGLEDELVPPEFSRIFAHRIPHARLELVPGEGHYSLPIRRAREILELLI